MNPLKTPVNDFFACFDRGLFSPGGIEDTVENQAPEQNLSALRRTMENADFTEEGADICLAASETVFEHAISLNLSDYLMQAVEITQIRIDRVNALLSSDTKIILLQQHDLDEEELQEEAEMLHETIKPLFKKLLTRAIR